MFGECEVCGKPIVWSALIGAYIHRYPEDYTGDHRAVLKDTEAHERTKERDE